MKSTKIENHGSETIEWLLIYNMKAETKRQNVFFLDFNWDQNFCHIVHVCIQNDQSTFNTDFGIITKI